MEDLRYPVGLQSFSEIIEGGYVYVDKTNFIYQMQKDGKYYFISRPRRFGKSLFISTLEAYFQGRRDLFKGLALDRDDIDWQPRPVFHFSFNHMRAWSVDNLLELLDDTFEILEEIYGKDEKEKPIAQRFMRLLKRAHAQTGRKVAILVDEYDFPILESLAKPELNDAYRDILKEFFTVLKDADPYVHFVFVTGISRFSHTSLFSGANNIPDMSLDPSYATLFGISEEELHHYFKLGIQNFANKENISETEALLKLKDNYDGYHFTADSPDIYNPYSLLRTLKSKDVDDYWFGSGTPSYLIKTLERADFFLPRLECIKRHRRELMARDSHLYNPVNLMFESGYLTIKDYDSASATYTLGIPNKEVGSALSEALLPVYSERSVDDVSDITTQMREAVTYGHPELFLQLVQTFLEGNPYTNSELAKRETYFKNSLFLILRLLGFMPRTEEQTCSVRTDLVLKVKDYVYIFELKVNSTASKAMEQILEKGYHLPYRFEKREVILIGANYSTESNNIDSWEIAKATFA